MTKALEHRENIMKTLTFPKKTTKKNPKEKSHKAVPQIKKKYNLCASSACCDKNFIAK